MGEVTAPSDITVNGYAGKAVPTHGPSRLHGLQPRRCQVPKLGNAASGTGRTTNPMRSRPCGSSTSTARSSSSTRDSSRTTKTTHRRRWTRRRARLDPHRAGMSLARDHGLTSRLAPRQRRAVLTPRLVDPPTRAPHSNHAHLRASASPSSSCRGRSPLRLAAPALRPPTVTVDHNQQPSGETMRTKDSDARRRLGRTHRDRRHRGDGDDHISRTVPDHAAHDSEHHMMGAHNVDGADLHAELAQVRRATARFHDLDAALEAGYELGWVNGSGTRIITGCVAHPTAGAMGYHYFNEQLMDDLAVDLLQPEVLVYAPGPDGQLRLVAVEWVARGPELEPSRGVRTAQRCLGCRCTSSSRRSGSTSCTPGCGSPTRQGCSRTGTPRSPAPRRQPGRRSSAPPPHSTHAWRETSSHVAFNPTRQSPRLNNRQSRCIPEVPAPKQRRSALHELVARRYPHTDQRPGAGDR